MKKLTLFSLVSIMLFLITPQVWGQHGLRYSIQVSTFEDRSGWRGQWSLGDAWNAVLIDKLQKSDSYIVVSGQDLRDAAMDDQDFASSGRTAGGNKAPKTGQMTPAQLIVKGVITGFDPGASNNRKGTSPKASISGTVYLVDTSTGQVVGSKDFEATFKPKDTAKATEGGFAGNLRRFKKTPAGKVMDKAAVEIIPFLDSQLDSILWTATIIKGGDDRIIINRGSREGVTVGTALRIGDVEDVRDPETGEISEFNLTETGRIEVTRVKEKIAYCKKISGRAPKKGQRAYH